MGALHEGHLSLIDRSASECELTVCSIFVNPTQFNDPADLARYPRMPEKDIRMLENSRCDVLFMPEVAEIYPKAPEKAPDLGKITRILEGAHRPGHFDGVAQVVKKLFEIVQPDKAYFGSKDYQQVMVIRELVRRLKLPVEIKTCPTIRENDGLAMSSRNALLSSDERKKAALIPSTLQKATVIARQSGVGTAIKCVEETLQNRPEFRLDYFEICDPQTLEPVSDLKKSESAVALIAVWLNKIRLIDNLTF